MVRRSAGHLSLQVDTPVIPSTTMFGDEHPEIVPGQSGVVRGCVGVVPEQASTSAGRIGSVTGTSGSGAGATRSFAGLKVTGADMSG